ncbi:hypothetical protein [Paracoccus subflavus]|uniref:hypothetical protein n=1 Tax=Paracoccus subflavus TaxID=2528244 RepID=UPI0014792625|nr:hypothetical protein [Paracoccus subflavus]
MAKPKLAPMSVSVGAPMPSFVITCQRVCLPRGNPMPMQSIGRGQRQRGGKRCGGAVEAEEAQAPSADAMLGNVVLKDLLGKP